VNGKIGESVSVTDDIAADPSIELGCWCEVLPPDIIDDKLPNARNIMLSFAREIRGGKLDDIVSSSSSDQVDVEDVDDDVTDRGSITL
jgi:hypothetical protein